MLLGNAPALAAQSPPLLSGLWVTQKMPANDFELSSFAKAVAANPNLTGICLHIGWKDIEKQSGKLDFSAIDKTVEVLRQIGRKYELSVKPGAETPAYVYEEGAKPFLTRANNPHRPNFGQKLTIPVPTAVTLAGQSRFRSHGTQFISEISRALSRSLEDGMPRIRFV